MEEEEVFRILKSKIGFAESGGKMKVNGRLVKNPYSTAKGIYQFIDSTWRGIEKQIGRKLDKHNRNDNEIAMNKLMQNNASALKSKGIPVNPTTMYMMHIKGDSSWVSKALKNPNAPTSSAFSQDEMASNKWFPRTLGGLTKTLSKKVNYNFKNNTMASINDPIKPTLKTWKNKSEKEKAALDFIQNIEKLSGDAKTNYINSKFQDGTIGYNDATGQMEGGIADDIKSKIQFRDNKAKNEIKAKKIIVSTFGKAMQSGLKRDYNYEPSARTGVSTKTGKSENLVSFNNNDEVVKMFNKAFEQVKKLTDNDPKYLNMLNDVGKKLYSKNPKVVNQGLLELQKNYSTLTGSKANLFNVKKDGSLQLGNDLSKEDDYFSFKLNGKEFNIQDPTVVPVNYNTAIDMSTLPTYAPAVDSNDTSIDGIDDIGNSDQGYVSDGIPEYTPTKIDYLQPEVLDIAGLNKEEQGKRDLLTAKAISEEALKDVERKDKLKNTAKEDKDAADLNDAKSTWETFSAQKPKDVIDPNSLKSEIPFAEIASGLVGTIIGKDMMDEPDVVRDERINNGYLSFLNEQRRIAEMGMNPSDEAAAKSAMAEAYQIGVQNITNASSGNRNLILGNMGNLDHSNAKNLMSLAMKDAEMKQEAFESYGKAMEVVNNFEAQRGIANNERKYQKAIQKQTAGASVFAGAFAKMTDALEGYDKPGSQANMFKTQQEIDMWGFSKNIKDDGSGTKYGTYSYAQKNRNELDALNKKDELIQSKLDGIPEEDRNKLFRSTKGMSIDQQRNYFAKSLIGDTEMENSDINVVKTDPLTGKTQTTAVESKATVPMTVESKVSPNGSETITPASIENTNLENNQVDNSGIKIPNFSSLGEKGFSLSNYSKENETAGLIARLTGREKEFEKELQTKEFLKPFGETDDERFSFAKNIIEKIK